MGTREWMRRASSATPGQLDNAETTSEPVGPEPPDDGGVGAPDASLELNKGPDMVGRSSPEAPEPAGLLYAADVSDSPHLDETLSWVTTEEVQSTDPLAGQFDHAAWIDETAIATVGTVAAGTIAADIGEHPLVEDTRHDDLEVLYVRAPGLMHTDVQLLTAAALASRVPVSVPPLPAAAPEDEAQQPNPLFVVGALGLVALIIAAFAAGGWWTSRTGEDEPIAFGDVGTDTVPTQRPIGAIAAPTTTVAAAAPVDQEAVLASATEALRNAGYSGMSVRYEGDLLVLEGVIPATCQHKYMRLVDVRIANIFGMQTFKHALHEVGASKFPILLAELPTANGGSASPEIAARMLKEIEQFEAIDIIQTQVFLADDEKRIAIQEYLPSRQGVFSHHAGLGIDLGVDEYGFFVARRHREDTEPIAEMAMTTCSVQEPREDLFRAVLFEVSHPDHETFHFSDLRNAENVVTVSGDSVKHSATANFSDTESGNVLNVPLGQKRRYRALAQNIGPDYFEYILTPLRTVCEASIQTGNPIQWT